MFFKTLNDTLVTKAFYTFIKVFSFNGFGAISSNYKFCKAKIDRSQLQTKESLGIKFFQSPARSFILYLTEANFTMDGYF